MCTVQAPHCAMPQPYFVPVRPDDVAQGPEERCIGFEIELVLRAVDCDRDHRQALLTSMTAEQTVAPMRGPSNGLMVPGE